MIQSVKVTNYLGNSLTMNLGGSDSSGLLIKSIDGLGPSKATINFSLNSTSDGDVFNSAYVNSRNIVLELLFKNLPTVETNRRQSYAYFQTKKEVDLVFTTDAGEFIISGHVESNEPNIFSSQSGTQISVICSDPFFYSLSNYLTIFYGIEPFFEFEFSNESLTENLLEFGIVENINQGNIYYDGDEETGIYMEIVANGDVTGLVIYSLRESISMSIDSTKLETLTGSGIKYGDVIYLSTLKENRSIYLYRDGLYVNILNCIDKDSDWFTIFKGDNQFIIDAASGLTNIQLNVYHKNKYVGI